LPKTKPMFHHYLITRFNLRNPKWDVTKNNETLLTDDWMEDRMWLFENFCFPSVTAQTSLNFTWLIFLDITTKDIYKNRIDALTANISNIEVFYIDGMPSFYPEIKKYITAKSSDIPHLITSRIDNDDCIHKDFIGEVQKRFKSQDYQAIDVIKGYSLQIKPNFMLGKKEHIFNPFISLIEKNNDPKTVWFNDHNLWKKETRITQVKNKRLWMSIIHEKNKVNEFDGYDNVQWQSIHNDFIVSKAMDAEINAKLIPQSKWLFLSLKNNLYVKSVLFSKVIKKTFGIYKIKESKFGKMIVHPEFSNWSGKIENRIGNFAKEGELLGPAVRNSIKIFDVDDKKINIKSFKIPALINAIVYRFFRKSKAKRSYEYANILLENGIGTPQPIAFLERFGLLTLKDSYYVSEQLNVDLLFRELTVNPEYPEREIILRQFIQFSYKLHQKGIEFIDNTSGNTLIKKTGEETYAFYLVDLNRMNFHHSMPFEKCICNLAKLTTREDILEIMSDEYAKLSGRNYDEVFRLMKKTAHLFQDQFKRRRRIKKRLKFWKKS
jgi:hypothetical protein